MRVRKHRDWRSHSPLIYVPLGLLLFKLANAIPDPSGILIGVICGIVFSYWSHLFADIPNKGGIQFSVGIIPDWFASIVANTVNAGAITLCCFPFIITHLLLQKFSCSYYLCIFFLFFLKTYSILIIIFIIIFITFFILCDIFLKYIIFY